MRKGPGVSLLLSRGSNNNVVYLPSHIIGYCAYHTAGKGDPVRIFQKEDEYEAQ